MSAAGTFASDAERAAAIKDARVHLDGRNTRANVVSELSGLGWNDAQVLEAIKAVETERAGGDPDAAALQADLFKIEREKGLLQPEKRKRFAVEVVGALLRRGRLFFHAELRDHRSAMFFDSRNKVLMRLGDPVFQSWLARFVGINRSEPDFRALLAAVEDEALQGQTVGIIPETLWAARKGALYLSNGDGQAVRITAGVVDLVDNGTDDVLFQAGDTLAPWALTAPDDPFVGCALFRDANFVGPHGIHLLRLFAISFPANHACKPILVAAGGIGSGKTLIIRGVARLYGIRERTLQPMEGEGGKRDFWISMNAGGLVCMDNADTKIPWLADALAAASTDGGIERKQNYEDTKRINLRARAWLAVTSANPTFGNDSGLADRLQVVRMASREFTASESALLAEIEAKRDAGLSFIAEALAAALADQSTVPSVNRRHPDYGALAVRIGRAIGREREAVMALQSAEADKPRFCLENDTLGSGLLALVESRGGFMGGASDLLGALRELDAGTFQSDQWTAKRVGKRIAALWPHVRTLFHADESVRQGSKHYEIRGFRALEGGILEKSLGGEVIGVLPNLPPQTPKPTATQPADLSAMREHSTNETR